MDCSTLKKKGKDIVDGTVETLDYAISSPGSFAVDTVMGTGLLISELSEGKKLPSRLYDDRCKRCAKVTLTGLLVLVALAGGYKACKHYSTNRPTPPPITSGMTR